MAQEPILELLLGYLTSEMAWGDSAVAALNLEVLALVEWWPC